MDKKSLLLYAITDSRWLKEKTLAEQTEEVLRSGATFLQLREKDADDETLKEEALALKAVAAKYHVPFVLDDNVRVAKAVDADGVHVGQSDMAYEEAREILGPDKIIGISAGNLEEAVAAEKAGADYIGVGAMFNTDTKAVDGTVPFEVLKEIIDTVSIPVVAIGGINPENARELAGMGLDGICVISAIYGSEDPAAATRALRAAAEDVVK